MAIEIPSNNIYSKPTQKFNDVISNVEYAYNNITTEKGNILDKVYNLVLYKYEDGVFSFIEESGFSETTIDGIFYVGGRVTLNISKRSYINYLYEQLGTIYANEQYPYSYGFYITLKYRGTNGETIEIHKNVTAPTTTERYEIVSLDKDKIVVDFYFHINESNPILSVDVQLGSAQGRSTYLNSESATGSLNDLKVGYKIQPNELLQNDNLSNIANSILSGYNNGKITATIRCSIADYYDYSSGEKVISANNWNLLDSDRYLGLWNANYVDGQVSQITADTATTFVFQLQAYNGGEFYKDLNNITVTDFGRIHMSFKKESDFSQLRFKLNGTTQDTGILFDVSNLTDGKTYCFSALIEDKYGVADTELTQGRIAWKDMQLNVGARAREYAKFGLPMAFKMYDEVVPMNYTSSGEDIPMATTQNGNPISFKVVGIKPIYNGASWQEIYVQEYREIEGKYKLYATLDMSTQAQAMVSTNETISLDAQNGDTVEVYYTYNNNSAIYTANAKYIVDNGIYALGGDDLFFPFQEAKCVGIIYLNTPTGDVADIGRGALFGALKSTDVENESIVINIMGFKVIKG